MNANDFTILLNKPQLANEQQHLFLEKIVNEFPYFQSARALQLKSLYNQDSFKYNQALKVTAAHTTDRSVLFEFITSNQFISFQKEIFDKKELETQEIEVKEIEFIKIEKEISPVISKLEQSIITSINEAAPTPAEEKQELIETKLEIGKPLGFSTNEKHSFTEWLQLSHYTPIKRENEDSKEATAAEIDEEKKKKLEIIDRFIEANPKIPPVKNNDAQSIIPEKQTTDHSYLMTETLARVYLEQKKYQKAIQAYEILILKYPEKITFFADRISDIKILQQNNN